MTITAKVLYTGKTHTTAGRNAAAKSSDGFLDLKLPQPHPAAENMFAAAWSACYLAAIQLVAGQRKVKIGEGPAVDAEIDLNQDGSGYFLRARLRVTLPGVDRGAGQEIIEAAHGVCPYSKAVHGNIEIETTLA